MAEYINREDLLATVNEVYERKYGRGLLQLQNDVYRMIINRINGATAVDMVKVVQCKDCEHGRPINKTKSPEKYYKDDCIICECEDVVGEEPMVYLPSHFCSYGKMKVVRSDGLY